MRTVEPIPHRSFRGLDDEPLVNSGIPAGRLGNRTFHTASEARQAAILEAKRLNRKAYPGHFVARSDAHRPRELPHYHVIDPQGKQISGHFFYGRKPYRVEPGLERNPKKTIAAVARDLKPLLLSWQEERQRLQEKLKIGQANRQEKEQLEWLNHRIQHQKQYAQQLSTEIYASRQSKQKAQREQEGETSQQSQWLFEMSFVPEFTRQNNYSNFELIADREAPTTVLRSLRFRNDSRLQATANNRPSMRQGERGRAVQKLQQALIDLGFPMPISTRRRGTPDGIYGAETTTTIRKFQRKHRLKVNGIVGRDTMRRLDHLFASRPQPRPQVQPSQFKQLNLPSNGCRTVTKIPCPGQKGQWVLIEHFPDMFLVNRGTCPLFIGSLVNGRPTNFGHLQLQPGESATFVPDKGSNVVVVGCLIGCEGYGLLEHPFLCA